MHSLRHLALLLATVSLAQGQPVKAVAWNIEWFPGGNPKPKEEEKISQTKAVTEKLTELKPDILLVQEITSADALDKLIASLPGNLKVHVCSRFMNHENNELAPQQVAIISNLKADSAFFENFKPNEALPNLRRGFAFAALEHPAGGLIMTYSVHLKSNHGSDTPEGELDVAKTRAESVKQILSHKAEMEKRYAGREIKGWLIGGDFNTNHDGQFPKCTAIADLVKAGFHNSWGETPKEQRPTWFNKPHDTRFQPTTFDYILTMGFKPVQATSIPTTHAASDHRPIVLVLENP